MAGVMAARSSVCIQNLAVTGTIREARTNGGCSVAACEVSTGLRNSRKSFSFISSDFLRSNGLSSTAFPASPKWIKRGGNGPLRVVAREEVRTEQKVKVVLGPYKGGAIKVQAPAPKVSEEDIEKALKEKLERKSVLERINFTGSGAKIGHTVKLKFEGVYADGPNNGQTIKGTKADNYELELKERDDEPWSTFVREITRAGMGQEESKTFMVSFPADYKAKALAGVRARFTATVKEIGVKKELPVDSRPVDVIRREVEDELRAAATRVTNEAANVQIRIALLASTQADVEKVAASVTWAKFGEKSLNDFKWNVVMEEVARVEGITFEQVLPFLRENAEITLV